MGEQQYDWFFVDSSNERNGPHTRDELLSRWRTGEVRASTMVWAPGMGAWSRFEQAFVEQMPPAPPSLAVPPPVEPMGQRPIDRPVAPAVAIPAAWSQPAEASAGQSFGATTHNETGVSPGVHPWRRYFAKQCDVMLLSVPTLFLIFMLLEFASPEASRRLSVGLDNQVVGGVIMLFFWAILEWLCLTLVGTTPGRALYGIKLRMMDGSRIGGDKALSRAFLVGVKGLGLGIPLIALVTCIVGYNVLNKDGQSTWDADLGTQVTHTPWTALRAVCVVLVTAALFLALIVLIVAGEAM